MYLKVKINYNKFRNQINYKNKSQIIIIQIITLLTE